MRILFMRKKMIEKLVLSETDIFASVDGFTLVKVQIKINEIIEALNNA